MGITLAMCRLSEKREAMLREDPSLVWELSREVPGYLDVGKAWDALRVAVGPFDTEDVVSKAFSGGLGKSFGESGAFGKPRIVTREEVARLASAMPRVPDRFVQDHFGPLRGVQVHGDYFRDDSSTDDPEVQGLEEPDDPRLSQLEGLFARVRALVLEAAQRRETLLVVYR